MMNQGLARSLGRSPLPTLLIGLALLGAGCGGDDDGGGGVSPEDLASRLPAAEDLKLETEREFTWDNSTDFAFDGFFFSEGTTASELIATLDDAGFEAGAGARLKDPAKMRGVQLSVAQFESDDGAVEARELLHAEDLKQPCFAACTVTPTEYELDGIPGSAAVHHMPNEGKPPPGLFKFEAYHAEFAIGSQLYVIQMDSPPDPTLGAAFDDVVASAYKTASESSSAG